MGIVTTADDVITGQGRSWNGPPEVLREIQESGVRTVGGDPKFLVSARPDANGVVDEDLVGLAVSVAAGRFGYVTYEGLELDGSETEYHYTPNFVLGPVVTPDGLMIWADTKAEIPLPMLEKMTAILVEELERAGASAHVAAAPHDVSAFDFPEWSPAG